MKRTAAMFLLLPALALIPTPASAGSSQDAALALGAFAVFNQIVRGETVLHDLFGARQTVIVHEPPVVIYAPPAVVYAPPPVVYVPAPPPVVVYPHVVYPHYDAHPKYYKHYKHHRHYKHYQHSKRFKKHDDDD